MDPVLDHRQLLSARDEAFRLVKQDPGMRRNREMVEAVAMRWGPWLGRTSQRRRPNSRRVMGVVKEATRAVVDGAVVDRNRRALSPPLYRDRCHAGAGALRHLGLLVLQGFHPGDRGLVLVDEAETSWDVRFTLKLVKRFRYVLRMDKSNPNAIRWKLLEGMFKSNDGGWDLEPIDGGKLDPCDLLHRH